MKTNDFEAHPIWATIGKTGSHIAAIQALADPIVYEDTRELTDVYTYCQSLKDIDKHYLVSSSSLDGLGTAWAQVNASLRAYLSNPSQHGPNLRNAAGGQLDAVRSALLQLPEPSENASKKSGATRAASEFRKITRESIDMLREEIDTLQRERSQLRSEHVRGVTDLEQELSRLSSEIVAQRKQIGDDETRLRTALTSNNEAFNSSQTERQESFGGWLKTQEANFNELASPHLEAIQESEAKAANALVEVNQLRTSVVDMANIASGDIVGDQYKRTARGDRIAGYLGYALGALAAAAGICIILYAWGNIQDGLDWPQVALKLGLTTGVGGVATVAFRFGGRSLARATAFKRQELELRSLTPFLHGVEKSDEAKIAFIREAFGKAWLPDSQDRPTITEERSNAELIKLAQAAVETINKTVR